MDNQCKEPKMQQPDTPAPDTQITEGAVLSDVPPAEENAVPLTKPKKKLSKKVVIIGSIGIVVLAAIAFAIFYPTKFERVKNECLQIAGSISYDDVSFSVDTKPDAYDNMDSALAAMLLPGEQKRVLEAIRYTNEALGFSGSLYSDMMDTTALMGRQSEENSKYKVTWTYHPDDGLEVTYIEKH